MNIYLKQLEEEAIYIMREVLAEFENPVMLYSVGKDSSVMVRLAQKAFYPGKIPFPLMHVDTGYKFPEMYQFREQFCKEIGATLLIKKNEEWISKGMHPDKWGTDRCCGYLKTQVLLNALKEENFDVAFGGARREEEKSRAKERIFSVRDEWGQWHPKKQRPEVWDLYNTRINHGESIRIFPLSNWTELDIWQYIKQEKIEVVPLYFAEEYQAIRINGILMPVKYCRHFSHKNEQKETTTLSLRFRSLGCMPCTGAIESKARTIDDIIAELQTIAKSERENRIIDLSNDHAMEAKKREGYF